jgi:membrane-associated phospholipid phosphatase
MAAPLPNQSGETPALARARAPWPLNAHWAVALGVSVLWLLLALALDKSVYGALKDRPYAESDFLRLLRVMGVIPTWVMVALVFVLVDRISRKADGIRGVLFRGSFVLACTIASGILGEAAKLLVRRQRPEVLDGQYSFRPYSEHFWSTSNLGMPSTHAAVAFAGAWALYRLHPAGWPVYFALAIGCAATRVMEHAHFLSDVYVACAMSYFVVRILNLAWKDPGQQAVKENTSPKENQ